MKVCRFLIGLLVVVQGYAQQPVAVKFSEVGNSKELSSVFIEQMDAFIKRLRRAPKGTRGVITVAGDEYPTMRERLVRVKKRVRSDPQLKQRISIFEPGTRYDKMWSVSEFWLIPQGADPPYNAFTDDYFCPLLEILGAKTAMASNGVISFTANVSGGPNVSYHWTIKGGKIIEGNATPSIRVRVSSPRTKEVTARIEIADELGDLEEAGCITKASFSTRILSE